MRFFGTFLCTAVLLAAFCGAVPSKINLQNDNDAFSSIKATAITISVSPTLLLNDSSWTTVTWSGVHNPAVDDWVGLYAPETANFYTSSPIKYQFLNASDSYMTTGSGSWKFHMINMHSTYVFVLMRHGLDNPVYAAHSQTVEFENMNLPMQGHLALTNNPSEMSWAIGMNEMEQQVQYGTEPGHYHEVAYSDAATYSIHDVCGGVAGGYGWKEPGYLHSAVMTGLQSDTTYYYRFGSSRSGFSKQHSFTTGNMGPKVGVSIIAFGDMGKSEIDGSLKHWLNEQPSINTTNNILSWVEEGQIDLVLHIGDISYAVGYASQWDEFMWQIEPIATKVPYMTCIGNHERDFPESNAFYNGTDSGGECGVPYNARFIMPGTENTKDKPWYSFDYGNVHFILMSTEHNFQQGSEQHKWIEGDLKSVNRKQTPWIIFSGHRPMYVNSNFTGPVDSDQVTATLMRKHLEDLLLKYQVNLALWGHNHSYQRTCSMYNNTCQATNSTQIFPTHVVIGMAGFSLTHLFQDPTPPIWTVLNDQEWGYTKISTTSQTLKFQFFNNNNEVRDEFTLDNPLV